MGSGLGIDHGIDSAGGNKQTDDIPHMLCQSKAGDFIILTERITCSTLVKRYPCDIAIYPRIWGIKRALVHLNFHIRFSGASLTL